MQGCQAFFCDEIGPLEVLQAKGWIKALDIVDERRCEINVITFRPSLKEYFCRRYPAMILYDLEIAGDDVKIVKDVKHLIGNINICVCGYMVIVIFQVYFFHGCTILSNFG